MHALVNIDGSVGEGGGQILRSSLALSMVTGRPFRITRVRAGREKPGLMRQHLTCIQAAQAICGADVTGDAVGSQDVSFIPGKVFPGSYHFPIGTAGSTTMVLQAILPALLLAGGPSRIVVGGGTHNKSAPPFDFFQHALLPLLNRAGAQVEATLERHGFYPAGGGSIVVEVQPATPRPLEVSERGRRLNARAVALVSRLPRSIAVRELEVLRDRIGLGDHQTFPISVDNPVGPGNAACVHLQFEHITEVFSAVGEVSKSAELVARELADEVRDYTAAQKPVGPYLADQLMVPLAVLAGGSYATGPLTDHSRTNMGVIAAFGGRVDCGADGVIHVSPLAAKN